MTLVLVAPLRVEPALNVPRQAVAQTGQAPPSAQVVNRYS